MTTNGRISDHGNGVQVSNEVEGKRQWDFQPNQAAIQKPCFQTCRELERKGDAIGMADSLIAGIAVERDGILLTRNRKHYERVPGIKLSYRFSSRN